MVLSDVLALSLSYSHVGCRLSEPSIDLGENQLSLWLITSREKGEVVSKQGYWGSVVLRKPNSNTRTVCDIYEYFFFYVFHNVRHIYSWRQAWRAL